ncbi:type I DNA topoisomerase [Patescibacteria group bacterium]|nr:type I DNA topoisomerase [Patescibacteria group bacterium]
MAKNLVIVESPTKAKTISKFLDKSYRIESSFGHIRDLPKSEMGIDIKNNFEPKYVIPLKAKKKVNELKKLAAGAETIYYATDEDREGEAIAWHLDYIFGHPKNTKRIAFHEITKDAVLEAIKNPRKLDNHLVDAQQARRVLDRLVGYELSPLLWKKVAKGLSAGRVQSVALRLIVEREREVKAFKPREYWTIDADFEKDKQKFKAQLYKTPKEKLDKFAIASEQQAKDIVKQLDGRQYQVLKVEEKETVRHPYPPFTTSTLQQQANRQLGFSAKQTMMLAQQLYEGVELGHVGSVGLITYMRTDSMNLADKFLSESADFIKNKFGSQYYDGKKFYKTKARSAQEAHEAIRPTDASKDPESIKQYLNSNQFKLYNLIWKRAVASQMAEAKIKNTGVDIISDNKYNFRATGSVIAFAGFLKLMPNNADENILPDLKKNDPLDLQKLAPNQHFTKPPGRYSEAGLVKSLEEYGIGRPSTYAPTIATIIERKYVEKEDKKLKPTDIGLVVNDLLVKHFSKIVDYEFTAKMENEFDDIASGKKEWPPIIKEFYQPFKQNLMQKEAELSKKDFTEEQTDEVCEKCHSPMIIKLGRYGKFMACSNYPECKNTKQLNGNGEPQEPETTDEKCDKCGKPMVIKSGRYGKFTACSGYPECKNIKNIEDKTGVKCPQCGQGDIVAKRSRRGKTFYSCNKYPECKYALWSKPTGEKCPDCGSLVVMGAKDTVRCSNKECKYTK